MSERDELVLRTLGFVEWVLRRVRAVIYVRPDLVEDVRAAGVAGLVQAAGRYDPERGSWLGYAGPRIRGAMIDALERWQASFYWPGRGKRRVRVEPAEMLPLKAAFNVPGRDEVAEVEARIAVAEILNGAGEHRHALEAYMAGREVPGLQAAIGAARKRLGVTVRDEEDAGRTFPVRRFWSNVPERPARGCWPWRGTITRQGFGQFSIPVGGRRWRSYLAHRIAWMLERGGIPLGARISQTCGNRRCVRPDHLRMIERRATTLAAAFAVLLFAACGGRAELPRDEEVPVPVLLRNALARPPGES